MIKFINFKCFKYLCKLTKFFSLENREQGGNSSFLNRSRHKKVQFSLEALIKCRCGICPVQFNSSCSSTKKMTRNKIIEAVTPELIKSMTKEQIASMLPKVDDVPGPYCATGVAPCKDLNFSKICFCNDCQVFKEKHLTTCKPTNYFCKDGKAR